MDDDYDYIEDKLLQTSNMGQTEQRAALNNLINGDSQDKGLRK